MITDVTNSQLDSITDDDKARVRGLLEHGSGSPYNRTILALIRDAERALVEATPEHRPAVWSTAYTQVLTDRQRAEKRVTELEKQNTELMGMLERAHDDTNTEAARAHRNDLERTELQAKLDRVYEWLDGYAKELSARGRLDGASPEDGVDGARTANTVREAAKQLKEALELPSPQKSLLHNMGSDGVSLTLEEASKAIQQHAPWNGKDVCDMVDDMKLQTAGSAVAATALSEIEKILAVYYKDAAAEWGEVQRARREKPKTSLPILDGEDGKLHQNERDVPSLEDGKS